MELPSHPEHEDDPRPARTFATDRGTWIVVIAIVLVLAAVVLLHLSGVVGPKAR